MLYHQCKQCNNLTSSLQESLCQLAPLAQLSNTTLSDKWFTNRKYSTRGCALAVVFVCLPCCTDDGEELVGAAVREEAAHGVSTVEGELEGEGRHTLLAVLMSLQGGNKEMSVRLQDKDGVASKSW